MTKCDHHVDVFTPSTAIEEFLPLKDVAHMVKIFPVRKTIRGSVYSSFYYIPPIKEKISLRDLENVEKEVATEVNEGGMMSYYENRINSQWKDEMKCVGSSNHLEKSYL